MYIHTAAVVATTVEVPSIQSPTTYIPYHTLYLTVKSPWLPGIYELRGPLGIVGVVILCGLHVTKPQQVRGNIIWVCRANKFI